MNKDTFSRQKQRCSWVNPKNPLYVKYHDEEWGVPLHDEHKLCELFILETFQAGISWECVLNKREDFRKAFDEFDLSKIAKYNEEKVQALLLNPAIIRNESKIRAAVSNAAVLLKLEQEFGGFSKYLWNWSDGKVIRENTRTTSPLSDHIAKDLKKRGIHFAGSTTIYSFLQACGIIYSHEKGCFLEFPSND